MTEPDRSEPGRTDGAVTDAAVALAVSALKAKARLLVVLMAIAFATFVAFAVDASRPLWLVAMIGFFGVILIGLFVALVAFWLHVMRTTADRTNRNAPD